MIRLRVLIRRLRKAPRTYRKLQALRRMRWIVPKGARETMFRYYLRVMRGCKRMGQAAAMCGATAAEAAEALSKAAATCRNHQILLGMALAAGIEYNEALDAVPYLEKAQRRSPTGADAVLAVANSFQTEVQIAWEAYAQITSHWRHPVDDLVFAATAPACASQMDIWAYRDRFSWLAERGLCSTADRFWRARLLDRLIRFDEVAK